MDGNVNLPELPDDIRKELHQYDGVRAVGKGKIKVDGNPTGEYGYTVEVENKSSEDELPSSEIIPREIDGVRVDVQECGNITEDVAPARKEKHRPFLGGMSLGIEGGGWNSVTSALRDEDGDTVVLTNSHSVLTQQGADVLQPATQHGGEAPRDTIGIAKDVSPLNEGEDTTTDSAVVKLNDWRTASTHGIGVGEIVGFRDPTFDKCYVQNGTGTGLISGEVEAVDVSVNTNYSSLGDIQVPVNGVTRLNYGGGSGDSGSGVYRVNRHTNESILCGLHYSSGSAGSYAVPISNIMDYHGELSPPNYSNEPDPPAVVDDNYTNPYFEAAPLVLGTDDYKETPILLTNVGGGVNPAEGWVQLRDTNASETLGETQYHSLSFCESVTTYVGVPYTDYAWDNGTNNMLETTIRCGEPGSVDFSKDFTGLYETTVKNENYIQINTQDEFEDWVSGGSGYEISGGNINITDGQATIQLKGFPTNW